MTDNPDKYRGFLTSADKEYLRGDRDLSEGSEYNTRRRIRERTESAYRDFTVLFEHLDESERKKIFHPEGAGWRGYEDEALYNGFRDAIALTLYDAGVDLLLHPANRPRGLAVDDLLEDAVSRIGLKEDFLVESVSNLEIEATRIRDVRRALEEGEDAPATALGKLIQTGDLSPETVEEIRKLIRADISDDEI